MKEMSDLQRALLISAGVVLALGSLAFWPKQRIVAPRPGLQAPIVFDELLLAPVPPTDSSKGAGP